MGMPGYQRLYNFPRLLAMKGYDFSLRGNQELFSLTLKFVLVNKLEGARQHEGH